MCLLCIELSKNKLSVPDFVKNFGELALTDPKHAEEVKEKFPEFSGMSLFDEEELSKAFDLLGFAD